jgi:hypothetical protein
VLSWLLGCAGILGRPPFGLFAAQLGRYRGVIVDDRHRFLCYHRPARFCMVNTPVRDKRQPG